MVVGWPTCWWLPRSLLLAAAEDTRAPGRDEADLLPGHRRARDGRRVAHVLVVASSVRVLHRIHRGAANLRPAIPLHSVLVEVVARLEHRLVHTTSASRDTDHCAASGGHRLPGTRRQADARLLAVVRMAHNHAIAARGTREAAAIRSLLLAHRDHGTFGHLVKGQHVADRQLGFGAGVNKLARVETLYSNPALLLQLVTVGVMEDNLRHWCAAPWIVDDLLDQTLDESGALGIVHGPKLHGTLPQSGLGGEDQAFALTRPT